MQKLNYILGTIFLCGSFSYSFGEVLEIDGLEDVVKASKRDDGKYNIICKDGSIEIGVTLEDLLNDQVCKGTVDETKPSKIEITNKDIQIAGPGCPNDSTNVTAELIEEENSLVGFKINYNELIVAKGPNSDGKKSRIFCNVAIPLKYTEGFQYSLGTYEMDGVISKPVGVGGTHESSVEFRGQNKKFVTIKKFDKEEAFSGPYKTASTTDEVWSDCGSQIPVNIKTTIRLTGSSEVDSVLVIKDSSSELILKWRKC